MSTLERVNAYVRGSATIKLIGVAILALLLLIPAAMVDSLVYERQNLRDRAVEEISSTWGASQRLAGPVLQVPYAEDVRVDDKVVTRRGSAYFLPEAVRIDGATRSEERYRGIYVAVLYTGEVSVSGAFGRLATDRLDVPAAALDWSRAALTFGVTDLRGIDSLTALRFGGAAAPVAFEPGLPPGALLPSGFQAPLSLAGPADSVAFDFRLTVRGSSALTFSPLAADTDVRLDSDWGTPKFVGAFLPDDRDIGEAGFGASWSVLEVNRPFAQEGTLQSGASGLAPPMDLSSEAAYERYTRYASVPGSYNDGQVYGGYDFGVRFLLPVDEYRKIDRSAKYSALFIAATFLTFFFIEVLNRRRIHPVQYLLIGFAVVLFYVLLLSLSEHLGFDASYAISVALILGLITAYAYSQLRSVKLTGLVAGVLAVLYVFFYSLLQLEDYALLLGSFGLLLALATVMWLTRRTDWYDLGRGAAPSTADR